METKSITLIDPHDSDNRLNIVESQKNVGTFAIPVTNPDGSNIGGPLDSYVTANYDTSTSTYYFGKIKSDGSWIIEKLVGGASTFCKGASDYSTNWTNRASLTYVLYSELE